MTEPSDGALLDVFAAHALTGILASQRPYHGPKEAQVIDAYDLAEEMMAERERRRTRAQG